MLSAVSLAHGLQQAAPARSSWNVRLQGPGSARRGDGGAPRFSTAEPLQRRSPRRADRSERAGAECVVSCAPPADRAAVKRLAAPLGNGFGGSEVALGLAGAPASQEMAWQRSEPTGAAQASTPDVPLPSVLSPSA